MGRWDGWMNLGKGLILSEQMEEQKLLAYFLNWFISKPIYRIISILDFDLLGKAKGVDVFQSLVLMLFTLRSHQTETTLQWLQGLLLPFLQGGMIFF